MSVSTIRAISVTILLLAYVSADLPSCARAKCVHCAVDFIDRMCPTACSGCKSQLQSPLQTVQRPPQPPPAFNNQPQFTQSVNTRQVSSEGGPQLPRPQPQQQIPQVPQQAPVVQFQQPAVQQQPQPTILNLPLQQHAQPVQFAAPNYQGQQIPYPQVPASPQVQTATLAPLVETPKINTFDPNLSRQPADLAQPLPEYQNGQVQFAQPASQTLFPQQQGYGQQVGNIFNQPNPFQLPTAQAGQQGLFGAPGVAGTQQQAGAFNPFQAFQLPQGQNALDPFNLFNLNANPLTVNQQGISTLQTQQQQQQYGQVQHQGNYNQNYNNQQPLQPQPQQQQQLQQQQYQQYNQQPQYQQYNQQPQQPYNQQPQPQQQQQQQQQQYQNVNNNYQPQPGQQQQLPVAPQPQVQQPLPQQPLPQSVGASVDSRPVNFEKYVDPGKGTPLAPPPAQCPRQPGWQPCITKETANDRFRNCCSRLGEGCAPLCNYDATLATMQLAVLTGRCPLGKVGDVMICASGYQDATQCCEAYGVFEPGYEHCRPYCNPSAGLPEGGLLTEKYKCLVKLSNIQQCFFVAQKP